MTMMVWTEIWEAVVLMKPQYHTFGEVGEA
jgi:hypothetical protein